MNSFIKQTLASFLGTIVALVVLLGSGTFGILLILTIVSSLTEQTTVKNKSVMVYDLSTPITDNQPSSGLRDVFSTEQKPMGLSLRQVVKAIRKASKDEKIVGIFLDGRSGNGGAGGYASIGEIREALKEFKATGKKIIAYGVNWSEGGYYLVSVADNIFVNPMGSLEINGFASQGVFFSEALEKLGIGVQVVRVGSYKSAVEPFTRKNFSPENRQQLQVLLNGLWQDFLTPIGDSRKLQVPKLQQAVNAEPFLTVERAIQEGLADKAVYMDELLPQLKELTQSKPEDKTFTQVALPTYVKIATSDEKTSENKIALVYAEGEIVDGQGKINEIGGDSFSKKLRLIRQDKDVKAVVLRINSPGGSATASEVIRRELQLIAKQKPLIVSMGDVAASGGYWIATAGEKIFAQPNTITGSIGVFGLLPNLENIANNNGITHDVVKTAPFADTATSLRPKNPTELSAYQKTVDSIYDMFLEKVSKGRNLPKVKVASLAQGRVWSGRDAQKNGLVDELGGLEKALNYAVQKASLEDDWEVVEYPETTSWKDEFFKKVVEGEGARISFDANGLWQKQFQEYLTMWRAFNDPKGVYARLTINIDPQ